MTKSEPVRELSVGHSGFACHAEAKRRRVINSTFDIRASAFHSSGPFVVNT
jgi:hypothetical protein